MKIYNYEVTELVEVSEIEYNGFLNELDQQGLLRKYLGRVYSKAIELHRSSLSEWKYGEPKFVRTNGNGLISIVFDTFDEFYYRVKEDGTVGWCRKGECEKTFPEYFENLERLGVSIPFRDTVVRPFGYFQ